MFTKRKSPILHRYVSPVDELINAFDQKNPKSASQQAEIKKHQRIAKRRDQAITHQPTQDLWDFE